MEIRKIHVEGDLAYLPLTKGYNAVIDVADIHLVEGRNWCAFVKSTAVYAIRTDYSGGKKINVYLHRLIMNAPSDLEVDHKNRDGLDNRRDNLRLATTSQNQQNCTRRPTNTSGFKGVCWHKEKKKWHARIMVNGKSHNLGYFMTPEGAHAAYSEASACLHSEFGRVA